MPMPPDAKKFPPRHSAPIYKYILAELADGEHFDFASRRQTANGGKLAELAEIPIYGGLYQKMVQAQAATITPQNLPL